MMGEQTLERYAIPIPPQLAGRLKQALGRAGTGFDEGAFLQQLHYWTCNAATTGWVIDGIKWVYNSLKSWQSQFPWMTEYGLRKAIANLKKLGLIQTAQHWVSQYQRVMFYRIDYERLADFAQNLRDQFTSPCVSSDQLDVRSDHITDTDISSDTSFAEQQTVVVMEENEINEQSGYCGDAQSDSDSGDSVMKAGGEYSTAASSGNTVSNHNAIFPELETAMMVAIGQSPGTSLPTALQQAIAHYPERVRGAIAYVQYQRQRRQIRNVIGYLYEAIVQGWDVSMPQAASSIPVGFPEWFDQARRQGLVLAATTINGIHQTLHHQQGWLPTVQIMQALSGNMDDPM